MREELEDSIDCVIKISETSKLRRFEEDREWLTCKFYKEGVN